MAEPTLMKIDTVPVADIVEKDRLRPVSEAGVESLIASVTELGVMKDPIHVRKLKNGTLRLMAGGHRLEMARRLGWTHIPAKVWTEVTDDWARLMEIDDNLAGAEMNALDTAVFLARRKEVYERLHPETKHATGAVLAAKRWDASELSSVASFTITTAEKFGMTDRQVRKIIAAGSRLNADEVSRLRGAPKAVTLADLQTLAKVNPLSGERDHVVAALVGGTAKNAAAARATWIAQERGEKPVVKDPVEEAFNTLLKVWDRAGKRGQVRFVDARADELIDLLNARAKAAAE